MREKMMGAVRVIEDEGAANFTFGVEIETTIPASASVSIGTYHHGSPVVDAPMFRGVAWKAERDGSIVAGAGRIACEFVSPILQGQEGIENVLAFVAWIISIGGKVNASCGLHVHVGVESVLGCRGTEATLAYVERATALTMFWQRAFYAQTGTKGREQGRYCAPIGASKKDLFKTRTNGGLSPVTAVAYDSRYSILNISTAFGRGTIEFRCFAGTLNAQKIVHHVASCLAVASRARTIRRSAWRESKWSAAAVGAVGQKALAGFYARMGWVRTPASRSGSTQVAYGLFGTLFDSSAVFMQKAREMAKKYDQGAEVEAD